MSTPRATDGLTARQERALLALLTEPTVKRAAEVAGVSEKQTHRWLRQPAFAAAYRAARREAFGHSTALLQKSAPAAVATLARTLTDPTAPHHARVSAATNILRLGREGIELDDLDARLADLERAAAAAEKTGGAP